MSGAVSAKNSGDAGGRDHMSGEQETARTTGGELAAAGESSCCGATAAGSGATAAKVKPPFSSSALSVSPPSVSGDAAPEKGEKSGDGSITGISIASITDSGEADGERPHAGAAPRDGAGVAAAEARERGEASSSRKRAFGVQEAGSNTERTWPSRRSVHSQADCVCAGSERGGEQATSQQPRSCANGSGGSA